MPLTSTVVIGAGFGDEGKGLITDFEVRRQAAFLVARFNGGAQAGHTVVDGDKRHVFGHIGAGTFAGAGTYLSSKFLVNPLVLAKEHARLSESVEVPTMWMSQEARISTIYDMALNSLSELSRAQRHGSCGLGINETVTRHENGYELVVGDLYGDRLSNQLRRIRDEYVPQRLAQLTNAKLSGAALARAETYRWALAEDPDAVADKLFAAVNSLTMYQKLKFGAPRGHEIVVLEGAQGLQLDEFMGVFPHVTRSVTGLPYALKAASELGLKSVRPLYVTRAYQTRHGAGPLLFEGSPYGQKSAIDETNITNEWQGTLRFAPLNVFKLKYFVKQDLERSRLIADTLGIRIETPKLAVTCLDQIGDWASVVDEFGESVIRVPTRKLPEYIGRALELGVSHLSFGPENKNVRYFPAE